MKKTKSVETNVSRKERSDVEKKKYTVVVHYEGRIKYDVSAKDEEEAKEIATEKFVDEEATALAEQLADCFVCDCWKTL